MTKPTKSPKNKSDPALPKIPDNLTVLTDEILNHLKIQRKTFIYWLKTYRVNGNPLGKKIGGRWYVDLAMLKRFVEEV